MQRNSLIIGFHTERKVDGKKANIVAAMQHDITTMREYTPTPCLQIFVSGPRGYAHITTPAERAEIAKLGIPVVIHGNYMDRPWGGSAAPVASVRAELKHAQECGATGVIVHLSSAVSDDEKLRTALHGVGAHDGVVFWLEIHTAKPSPQTYETPAKIATLFERVRRLGVNGQVYGLCIDTAHLWACGKSLATRESAAEWLREVDAACAGHPIMMHLNDSKKEFGGGVDQHDSLCQGNIWREYHPVTGSKPFADSGLMYIFEYVRERRIVTILERDMADLHYDFEILRHIGQ
jgi:endonuclease IV